MRSPECVPGMGPRISFLECVPGMRSRNAYPECVPAKRFLDAFAECVPWMRFRNAFPERVWSVELVGNMRGITLGAARHDDTLPGPTSYTRTGAVVAGSLMRTAFR